MLESYIKELQDPKNRNEVQCVMDGVHYLRGCYGLHCSV